MAGRILRPIFSSLTYKPWHIIAALPPEQQFQTPGQAITLTSSRLQASLSVEPGTALSLNRVVLVGESLAARSSTGWRIEAASARIATRQALAAANAHEIGLEVTGLVPDPALMVALAGRSDLPAQIDIARFDAIARFTAPLDRFVGETRPTLAALDLHDGLIRWGDLVLSADGKLTVGPDGFLAGRIDLRLENWRKAVLPAVALGLITPQVAPTIERAMELLAGQSPNPEVLELPLTFAAGLISLGPLPLGPAPRLN